MENISVFDMLKIGVGPSSSHTLGPWRATVQFLEELKAKKLLNISKIKIELYGSLSLTGKGHATDIAVMLGLNGADPEQIAIESIPFIIHDIRDKQQLLLYGEKIIFFNTDEDIIFKKEFLPFHPNGISFTAWFNHGKEKYCSTFYSIGGGFIAKEGDDMQNDSNSYSFPFPIEKASELIAYCQKEKKLISDIVYKNELSIRSKNEVNARLQHIWQVMLESIYTGCHTSGILPGELQVKRRAYDIHSHLIGNVKYQGVQSWLEAIRKKENTFRDIIKWVSCFALSVNEVNANLGRVVTAPTNGSAGVMPAVLMYYVSFINNNAGDAEVNRFLLVGAQIGAIFKKGATISAAMGGCQAEIGVSSAMAAGALCELMGGGPEQCLVAAEIAMEHHLGLTCDPIAGLVQIPCIERNTMGAIKAINASELALETNPKDIKVSMDKIVYTMWETAKDMSSKYKETSKGGLALGVNISDC